MSEVRAPRQQAASRRSSLERRGETSVETLYVLLWTLYCERAPRIERESCSRGRQPKLWGEDNVRNAQVEEVEAQPFATVFHPSGGTHSPVGVLE